MTKNMKVLVVEDEIITARCLCEDLKTLNIEPLEPVPSGEKAVQVALNENPDLILMDIRLAGRMDGIEAARIIKQKLNIPIIFMTGYSTDYVKDQAFELGCLEFLKKPVSMAQLTPLIHQMREVVV